MAIKLKFKASARLALAVSASFPLTGYAASAGKIDFAMGPVIALSTDGRSRPLSKGSEVNTGETINTNNGRAQLRYTDGSQVALQPGTEYRIDDYRYNGKSDGQEKAFFSLLKGGFRTITGLIGKANKDAYKVSTPVATIGIRGTEYVVKSDANGVTISTGDGLVQVCTGGGCIILASGESAMVADKDGKPVRVINAGGSSNSDKPVVTTSTSTAPTKEPTVTQVTQVTRPTLPSGPGYAMAWAGQFNSTNNGIDSHGNNDSNTFVGGTGTANFSATDSALTSFDGPEGSWGYLGASATGSMATVSASGFTDGTIGWGRWASGTELFGAAGTVENIHYVVGKPTSIADMAGLAGKTGTYSFTGATAPTSYESGVTSVGSASGISGSLTANFSTANVSYSLSGIAVAGATYGISGSTSFSNAVFSGGGTATGGTCTSSLNVRGLFVGANASRAGLVYQFDDSSKKISGAAAFSQSSLTATPPPC